MAGLSKYFSIVICSVDVYSQKVQDACPLL